MTSTWTIETNPAVCITLQRREDRWKRFQDQPAAQQMNVQRFLGVDGKTLDLDSDPRVALLTKRNIRYHTRRSHEELDSMGGVGCALSHIAVWQWMVEKQIPWCTVFEDDAVLPVDFIPRANHVIQTSLLKNPKHWDIWLLGGIWDDITRIPNESTVQRIGSFVLFHGYVITLPTAKKLLESAYPIHCHIDLWTSVYAHMNHLRLVGAPELRIEQHQKSKTDIQTDGCELCQVPTTFYLSHRLIPHWKYYTLHIALLAGIGYFTWRHMKL